MVFNDRVFVVVVVFVLSFSFFFSLKWQLSAFKHFQIIPVSCYLCFGTYAGQ